MKVIRILGGWKHDKCFSSVETGDGPLLKYLLARLQTLQLISSYDRTSAQLNSGRAVTAARSILFKSGGDICEGHYVPQTSANCHPFNMSVMLLCQVQPSGALPSPSGCTDQRSGLEGYRDENKSSGSGAWVEGDCVGWRWGGWGGWEVVISI